MLPESTGGYTHCALCNGSFYTKDVPDIDYTNLCWKHCDKVLWTIQEDDIIDAHDTLASISLYATLLRLLDVKEQYFRDP